MHILHVAAHLGGGVGKAHAALRAAMPAGIRQTYLLLEQPRDRRYADDIAALGGEIVLAGDMDHVAALCVAADIVQFEFWNHPKLFECLARTDFPPMRSVFWSHVSGLFKPVIASGFLSAADRFVFTSPASMVLGEGLDQARRARLSSIGSGFGFPAPASPTKHKSDIAYLGTVDFVKMHPGFFDGVDRLARHVDVAIWGGYEPDGEVAARARAMRHPNRIRFMGQTSDPQAALSAARIFFYPLQPDHYGTAENALIEAMSLGLVPVVLANPSESVIVSHGQTGFIGHSIAECTAILEHLLDAPETVAKVGAAASANAMEKYTPAGSSAAFAALWQSLLAEPAHDHDFSAITGRTPLDWYLATQCLPGEKASPIEAARVMQAKGTLAHFTSAFPDDPCWARL